jgi:uncharacterized membrane-anchored protein YjiN (DUF445 family)
MAPRTEVSEDEIQSYASERLWGVSIEKIARDNEVSQARVRKALTLAAKRIAPRTRERTDLTYQVVQDAVKAAKSLADAARKLGTSTRTLRQRLQKGE